MTRAIPLLVVFAMLGGCYVSAPMTIDVRDKVTHQPIPEAVVVVRSLNMFNPSGKYALLHPSPGESQRGVTDANGSVRLDDAACPGYVIVLCADRPPHSITYQEHPGITDEPTEWMDAAPRDDLPDAVTSVQVRLAP